MTKTQERLAWVDVAKGIGIVFVVFGHTALGLIHADLASQSGPLFKSVEWVYAFHMPLFFGLSGLFVARQLEANVGTFLVSRLRVVVYPYVLWACVQICIQSALSGMTNEPASLADLATIFHRPSRQYWFLYVLFLVNCFHFALARFGLSRLVTFGLSGVLHFALPLVFPTAWSPLLLTAYYLPLVTAAALLVPHLRAVTVLSSGWAIAAALACFGVMSIDILPMHSTRFIPFQAILGTVGTVFASVAICNLGFNSTLTLLGKSSLEIYVAHTLASAGCRIVLKKLGIQDLSVHLVGGIVAGIVFPLILIRVTKRLKFDYMFTLRKPATNPL